MTRERECTTKDTFMTKKQAHERLARYAKSGRKVSGQHAYRCSYCGLWHTGHPRGAHGTRA